MRKRNVKILSRNKEGMVGSIKRRTSRGKTIRRRNTVLILEGEENRKKEVRIIVAVFTD